MTERPHVQPGAVLSPRAAVVSVSELLKGFIDDNADASIVPAGAVVGGADDTQQQEGVVAIMEAGNSKTELYAPLLWRRCQIRCMGPSLETASAIGDHIFDLLNDQQSLELTDSEGRVWFVHLIYCATGPSQHIDSSETWESLLFANVTVGRDPISVPTGSGSGF